jgi:glycosyltransferase involved in cell wall biosynthesis
MPELSAVTDEDFLSIIIPAYNEIDNLEAVIQESINTLQTLTSRFEVIVVDDCSTDASWDFLQTRASKTPALHVIRNPKNIGCHPSSLVGFQAAQGDYRFFIPADRQIPAVEITKFLAQAKTGCDLVYSWRQHRADPPHRLWISGFYNLMLRFFFGIRVHDVDSAELLTRKAVDEIVPKLRSDSVFLTVEMLLETQRQGLSIGEVIIDHRPRVAGIARGLNVKDLSKAPIHFCKILWWFWQEKRKQGTL